MGGRWLTSPYSSPPGSSQVVGPDGTVIIRSGRRVEAQTVDIDVKLARNKKINRDNDIIADRRRGLYKL